MDSQSFGKSLRYKLRELELILKNIEAGDIPDRIDIDLALSKTRDLYDILLQINTQPSTESERTGKSGSGSKPVVPSDPEPVQEEKELEQEDISPDPVHKQPEDTDAEPKSSKDRVNSTQKEDRVTEQEYTAPPAPEQFDIPADTTRDEEEGNNTGKQNGQKDIEIVADRFQNSQNYLNKAMAEKKTRADLTSKMQSRPILDLRNSIGLNEKFLFIKELFKGRPDQYNHCIDMLNQTSSYEEALKFIKDNYDWKEDNDVAEKLISLIKRKHPAG